MTTEDSIQHLGHLTQAALDNATDPITANTVDYYKIYDYLIPWGDFPIYEKEVNARWAGGSTNINAKNVSRNRYSGAVAGIPVNALDYYLLYGRGAGASDAGVSPDAVHTFDPLSPGTDTPSFATRFITGNGTDYITRTLLDCRMNAVSRSIDLRDKSNLMGGSYQFDAKSIVIPSTSAPYTYTGTQFDSHTPIFPNATTKPYRFDANTVFTWDGDSMINDLLDISFSSWRVNKVQWVDGQDDPKYIFTSDLQHALQFTVRRGATNAKNLYTDFEAQTSAGTEATIFKNLVFKIYNSSTQYIQFTATEGTILMPKMNHSPRFAETDKEYQITVQPKSLDIVSLDGVANSVYGG